MVANKKELRREDFNLPDDLRRGRVRNQLFKIRNAVKKGKPIEPPDLKIWIESQFEFGMNWNNFTFAWDVSPRDAFEVITEDQWGEKGGSYDPVTGLNYPSSFTHQQ